MSVAANRNKTFWEKRVQELFTPATITLVVMASLKEI